MIATRALRNSRMINNGEGQGELSLKNRERERERIEALSREIWGRESGETGTRIINDLERQMFADNRLELLRLAFHILFFLSFEEFRIPRIVVELTNEIRTLWHGKIYWTSSKGISSGRKGGRSWLHTTIYNESIRAVGRRVLHVLERSTCKAICTYIRSQRNENEK